MAGKSLRAKVETYLGTLKPGAIISAETIACLFNLTRCEACHLLRSCPRLERETLAGRMVWRVI